MGLAAERPGGEPAHQLLLGLAEVSEHLVDDRDAPVVARVEDQPERTVAARHHQGRPPRIAAGVRRHQLQRAGAPRVASHPVEPQILERDVEPLRGPSELLDQGLPEVRVRLARREHLEEQRLDRLPDGAGRQPDGADPRGFVGGRLRSDGASRAQDVVRGRGHGGITATPSHLIGGIRARGMNASGGPDAQSVRTVGRV